MDARETLERRIDELCRENEQLRQQVASIIGRSFRTADKMDCLNTENEKLRKELEAEHALAETLGHYHEYAQAENAKLRELVRDLVTTVRGCGQDEDGYGQLPCEEVCPHWSNDGECTRLHRDQCWYEEQARELGIEVVG